MSGQNPADMTMMRTWFFSSGTEPEESMILVVMIFSLCR
ncbi:hypothetical protein [Morganella morganii IS15]|nr:hypothetical protein C790_03345 [Morganella morganii SC01]CDK64063.1 hypothetical protein [Morganella morganii IS15]